MTFPKVTNMWCLTLTDASLGCHHLKVIICNHLAAQFGNYRSARLPFRVAWSGNMFQQKNRSDLQGLSRCFWDCRWFLVVSYDSDGRNHNRILRWVIQICHQENLKAEQKQMLVQVHKGAILWWYSINMGNAAKSLKTAHAYWYAAP